MNRDVRCESVSVYRRNATPGYADDSAHQRRVEEREQGPSAWISYWRLMGWTQRGRSGSWRAGGAPAQRGE